MLTMRSKYGLKALLLLAREHARGPIAIQEMADRETIPRKFLELILLDLKRRGILHSRKGPGGGYQLGREPNRITLGEVIRILDGPLALLPCVSRTAYMKCAECADEESCGIRLAMKAVRDATAQILDTTTLAGVNIQVARRQRSARLRVPGRRRRTEWSGELTR
jgi:Rrf2 family protein